MQVEPSAKCKSYVGEGQESLQKLYTLGFLLGLGLWPFFFLLGLGTSRRPFF